METVKMLVAIDAEPRDARLFDGEFGYASG
jgi:hypothetical protein